MKSFVGYKIRRSKIRLHLAGHSVEHAVLDLRVSCVFESHIGYRDYF